MTYNRSKEEAKEVEKRLGNDAYYVTGQLVAVPAWAAVVL